MKSLNLTISERVFALGYLDGFKGSVSLLAKVIEDVKRFGVQPEEWEKAERKITKDEGNVQWSWSDEKGGLKDVEVDDDVLAFLKSEIDKADKAGTFSLRDKAVITLMEKVNAALK